MGSVVGAVMQPVGEVLGGVTGGLAKGMGVGNAQAPQINSPVSQAEVGNSQGRTLDQLEQERLLTAQLANQGGLGHQNNLLAQQQALANQLGQQASGQGPNPSQIQFGQNLNASTQAAAGQIASQKGINPAMAARLINMQQAGAGQNAAATSAGMQAQQQLGAQQLLAQQQAQMQGVAGQQIGQQIGAQNQLTGNTLNNQQSLLNAITGTNQANLNAASQTAASNQAAKTALTGGILQAGGAIAGGALGGPAGAVAGSTAGNGLSSQVGSQNAGMSPSMGVSNTMGSNSFSGPSPYGNPGMPNSTLHMAEGGEVTFQGKSVKNPSKLPDHLSHIASIYHPDFLKAPMPQMKAKGGYIQNYDKGEIVPGKAKVDHNSYSNDTVKALLSPGEVVIPLDVMNSKNPVQGAAKFVQAILNKKDPKKDKENFNSALKDAVKNRRKK